MGPGASVAGHFLVPSQVPPEFFRLFQGFVVLFFELGYICFTILCQFLLSNEVNQLYVYIYSLPLESPLIPLLQVNTALSWLPVLYHSFPLAICFTHGSECMSVLLSQLLLPSPSAVVSISKSTLYICVFIPALKIGSSVPFFQIPCLV